MKKFICLFLLSAFLTFSCTSEDNINSVCDGSNCITDISTNDVLTITDTGNNISEWNLCKEGISISTNGAEIVPNALIDFAFGRVKLVGDENGPAEKTQFDVILKSAGRDQSNITSNENGEFSIEITDDEYNRLPENFEILLNITSPENFGKEVKTDKIVISFFKYPEKKFKFVLLYKDGHFFIDLKDQLYKLNTKSAGAKKALDAFISATTKAVISDRAEPVPGAEIIIDKPVSPPKKEKKKTMRFSDSNKDASVIATCYEIESSEEITTNTNNEGYFSFKKGSNLSEYVLFTVKADKSLQDRVEASSMLIKFDNIESDILDFMLTFEKQDADKGRFILIGPIEYQPCSELKNPTCKPTKCKMIGGLTGKCQYLYDSTSGEYRCGCFPEVCNADCTGNCKMPDGKEGVCHIEEISSTYDGAEISNKRCVCGPIQIDCKINCKTDQDCISQTAGLLPLCNTDMYGNKFCTKGCDDASDCISPFSMCAKMGIEGRGVCICPCVHADNAQTTCNPVGLYNQQCNSVTYGGLTDCIDIDNDSTGECSLCCTEDKDCPSGMHCYDLLTPLNDKCKRACMCERPPLPNLCRECSSDQDCGTGEKCVDDDNNSNTPNVCTVPCGQLGFCPTNPVYTYCDYNISKYCICRHPTPNVDCNYQCNDNQDCIVNSGGQFDLCIPDASGIKRCTKSCADAKECPSPYSICIKYGDKSYCTCPCIHFDSDKVDCNQYGQNIPQCITKTNNSLPDCFDVDNDGLGECTHCCNDDKECPNGMICDYSPNARCDKVCVCKTHPISDVCQKCSQDTDCPTGFMCADDDNNNLTPNVCTRLCPSIYPCPTSPVYSYCDNNISKFCICHQSGTNLCETKCEQNSDCPVGLICVDDDVNPLTPKICTMTCANGCPEPMLCNNDANLPMAICMCPRDFCKECKDETDCGYGFKCIDSDQDPLTPKVCTTDCNSDFDCPLNLNCNLNTNSCDCNRCSKWSNEKCEPLSCYKNGEFGKCQFVNERCDCLTGGGNLGICKECKDDTECQSPLKCVDADNNPNTPKICSEPCSNNTCPEPSICDYNVSKYCFCK